MKGRTRGRKFIHKRKEGWEGERKEARRKGRRGKR